MDLLDIGTFSLSQAIGWLGLLFLVRYFLTAIYCVTFHPLAKYPGPFLSKISGWPSYLQTLRGNRHVWVLGCHQKYGEVFRAAPNHLLFDSGEAYEDIYGHRANVQKGDYYMTWSRYEGHINTWMCQEKSEHARRRRTMRAAFAENALRSYEPFIAKHVDEWLGVVSRDETRSGWTRPVDVSHEVDYLVFDILGELCFGRSFGTKMPGPQPLKKIPSIMIGFLKVLHPIAFNPGLRAWLWLKPRGLNALLNATLPSKVQEFYAFSETSLKQRLAEEQAHAGIDPEKDGALRQDLFHFIFRARDPETGGPGFQQGELFGESDLLIVAGSDTTALTLAAAMFYLVRNPQAYERLTDEVRRAFSHPDEVRSGPQLTACRYLRAVLDETLRMNPPVPGDLPRLVLPGSARVAGHNIPAGVTVGAALWALHHHARPFPDPWTFRPERWLAVAEDAALRRARAAFWPFSAGARACPGQSLAYIEMSMVLARMLLRLDVRRAPGDETGAGKGEQSGQYQVRDWFVSERSGPVVQFRRRGAF